MNKDPYRTLGINPAKRPLSERLPDADIVILLVILSPVFLAVVVRTLLQGEAFGAGATVCAALVVIALTMMVSAWRARGRTGRLP
jgi:hypothetical protein